MRFPLSFVLCLLGLTLMGQPLQRANWMTIDGQKDDGWVKVPRRSLHDPSDIDYRSTRQGTRLDPKQIRWLVCRGDTLFLRHEDYGFDRILQLLAAGEIDAYRAVFPEDRVDYYYRRGISIERVDQEDFYGALLKLVGDHQGYLDKTHRLSNDLNAIRALAEANQFLESSTSVTRRWMNNIWRLSTGASLYHSEAAVETRASSLKEQPLFLEVDRAVHRLLPSLRGVIRIEPVLARNEDTYEANNGFVFRTGTFYSSEESYTLLPISYGLRYDILDKGGFTLFVGGGRTLVLPLKYRRDFINEIPERSFSGFPDEQRVRGGLKLGIGRYFQVGARVALHAQWDVGFEFRYRQAQVDRNPGDYPQTYPIDFFAGETFWQEDRLIFNLSISYSWGKYLR